jgi:acetyl esterase/lipase
VRLVTHTATVVFLGFLALSPPCAPAQTQGLKVWENGIPGAKSDPSYVPETTYRDGDIPLLSRVSDPTLEYFPAPKDKANGTAVIICPGGAYQRLAVGHEGADIARWLNGNGVAAFVLAYRLPSDAIMEDKSLGPLQDAQEAVRRVRRAAPRWHIDPRKIGIMGFSAGGHLAASASTRYAERVYPPGDTTSARPDFSILIYPVISMDTAMTHAGSRRNLLGPTPDTATIHWFSCDERVTPDTPPAFVVHSADDGAVSAGNSTRYMEALLRNRVPVELHVYERGGHGYGLGRGNGTETTWPEACVRWLHARGLIP